MGQVGEAASYDQESGKRLLAEDEAKYEKEEDWENGQCKPRQKFLSLQSFLAILSFLLNAILGFACIVLWMRFRSKSPLPAWPSSLYSPANVAVEYETVTFNSDFPEDHSGTTVFHGASPEAEHAWENLMDPYLVQITGEEAKGISRPTSKISKDPDYYITGLDVYHQLHCLNNIRKMVAAYNTTDGPLDKLQTMHKFHCIDSIRQSLMCNADLSLIHFYWAPHPGKHFPNATTTHICRKWSKIEEWAREHRLDEEMYDPHRFVGE